MSYTGEVAFSETESAEVCAPISSHLANPNLGPITDPNPNPITEPNPRRARQSRAISPTNPNPPTLPLAITLTLSLLT